MGLVEQKYTKNQKKLYNETLIIVVTDVSWSSLIGYSTYPKARQVSLFKYDTTITVSFL